MSAMQTHRIHLILLLATITLTSFAAHKITGKRAESKSVTVYNDVAPIPQAQPAQPQSPQQTPLQTDSYGKTQKCPKCKGEGVVKEWIDCEQCAGTGKVPDGVFKKRGISGRTSTIQTRQKRCPACKDSIGWSGKVKRDVQCPRCNGSGVVPKN